MEYSNFRLTLDIHEASAQTCLTVKQGDTGRRLLACLTEAGRPYPISAECTAVFTARKPDGAVVFNGCTIDGGTIVYEMTPQTTAAPGQADCELRLYGADDRLLTSPRFTLLVDPTVYQEGDPVESAQEVTALTKLISQTTALVTEVEDKLASGAFRGQQGEKGEQGEPGAKGDKGDPGAAPVRGVDYFTDADKAQMVKDVVAALPVYDGEVAG